MWQVFLTYWIFANLIAPLHQCFKTLPSPQAVLPPVRYIICTFVIEISWIWLSSVSSTFFATVVVACELSSSGMSSAGHSRLCAWSSSLEGELVLLVFQVESLSLFNFPRAAPPFCARRHELTSAAKRS